MFRTQKKTWTTGAVVLAITFVLTLVLALVFDNSDDSFLFIPFTTLIVMLLMMLVPPMFCPLGELSTADAVKVAKTKKRRPHRVSIAKTRKTYSIVFLVIMALAYMVATYVALGMAIDMQTDEKVNIIMASFLPTLVIVSVMGPLSLYIAKKKMVKTNIYPYLPAIVFAVAYIASMLFAFLFSLFAMKVVAWLGIVAAILVLIAPILVFIKWKLPFSHADIDVRIDEPTINDTIDMEPGVKIEGRKPGGTKELIKVIRKSINSKEHGLIEFSKDCGIATTYGETCYSYALNTKHKYIHIRGEANFFYKFKKVNASKQEQEVAISKIGEVLEEFGQNSMNNIFEIVEKTVIPAIRELRTKYDDLDDEWQISYDGYFHDTIY